MYLTIQDWTHFLVVQTADLGIALAVAGAISLYFGRRFSHVLVSVNMAILGAGVAWFVSGWLGSAPLTALSFTLLSGGLLAYWGWRWHRRFAVVACAAACALFAAMLLDLLGWDPRAIAILQGLAFVAALAVASVVIDDAVMFLTAAEGGFAFVSGAMIIASSESMLFQHTWHIMNEERLLLMFSIVALTVTGYFLQVAEKHRETHGGPN